MSQPLRPSEKKVLVKSKTTKVFNIVVIGKTQTGKTTFINTLKNLDYQVEPPTQSSKTREPKIHNILLETDETITINIIDTPGIDEVSGSMQSRSDSVISAIIRDAAKMFAPIIHLVLVFVNGEGPIDASTLRKLNWLTTQLGPRFRKNLALMVTHFEGKGKKDEIRWKDHFKSVKQYDILRLSCGAGIFFTGTPKEGDMATFQRNKSLLNDRILRLIRIMSEPQFKPIELLLADGDSQQGMLTTSTSVIDAIHSISFLREDTQEPMNVIEEVSLKISHLKIPDEENKKILMLQEEYVELKKLTESKDVAEFLKIGQEVESRIKAFSPQAKKWKESMTNSNLRMNTIADELQQLVFKVENDNHEVRPDSDDEIPRDEMENDFIKNETDDNFGETDN